MYTLIGVSMTVWYYVVYNNVYAMGSAMIADLPCNPVLYYGLIYRKCHPHAWRSTVA
jgi:hypothetical protein